MYAFVPSDIAGAPEIGCHHLGWQPVGRQEECVSAAEELDLEIANSLVIHAFNYG